MPAVLVEVGFINSDTDNQLFDENFEAIAQAIADGILDTLKPEGAKPYYRVQVGLFRNWNYAQRLMEELQGRGFPAFLMIRDRLSVFKSVVMMIGKSSSNGEKTS